MISNSNSDPQSAITMIEMVESKDQAYKLLPDKLKNIIYINEQLSFFADLAKSRNYTWKKVLDSIFTDKQFLFD